MSMTTKFGLAQPVRRVEDLRLLLGNGRYTDDVRPLREATGVVLRSPHAAARIVSIDAKSARSMPGVLGVFTAADLKADCIGGLPCAAPVENRDGSAMVNPLRPLLADGTARHVGDPVAFIVAETAKAARNAAEAVAVEYEVLPAATDLAHAMDPGQPQVWPESKNNISFDWEVGDKARVEALFAKAAHVTRITVVNNRLVVASMEARAAVG